MKLINGDRLLACAEKSYHSGAMPGTVFSKIRRWVNKAPAVDAVPVIRCKNCKHYTPFCEDLEILSTGFCHRENLFFRIDETGYCVFAERNID